MQRRRSYGAPLEFLHFTLFFKQPQRQRVTERWHEYPFHVAVVYFRLLLFGKGPTNPNTRAVRHLLASEVKAKMLETSVVQKLLALLIQVRCMRLQQKLVVLVRQ
jgi:hypothetical protein